VGTWGGQDGTLDEMEGEMDGERSLQPVSSQEEMMGLLPEKNSGYGMS
jgi:hypothetical protein